MRSAFYEGRVRHQRLTPVPHRFAYRLWLLWLDLDEIDSLFAKCWLWSADRAGLLSYRREDHLGDPQLPLKQAVLDRVEEKLHRRPSGPVMLMTQLRYAGFWMNPVCFYFCYERDGETLSAVVAEVNNTPWNEQHTYVIDARHARDDALIVSRHPKEFHVSPFMGMEQEYRWMISVPGETFSLEIINRENGHTLFSADLDLKRRPWTARNRFRMAFRYPFQSLRVFAAIYWQALKLWWKKCPLYPHPKHHSSIPTQTLTPPN